MVAGTPEVRQFPGGASNLTYLLRYPEGDLILRRPPSGTKAKGAHDMGREYRVQAALAPVFPRVPAMVGLCEDESVIGSEFYVMEKVDGTILRQDFPPELDLTIEDVNLLCGNAIDVLIELHQVDPATPGLAEFERGAGYVERQVGGWIKRFRAARTDDVGDFEPVMTWLEENRPDDVGHCVIHNDFRFDNLVLAPGDPMRIVGVLDWEMATLGDPLMDLGCTLAYWVQEDDDEFFHAFRRQPTTAPGMWSREEVVGYYCEQMDLTVTEEAVAVLRGVRAVPARGHRPADLLPLLPRPDQQPGVRHLRRGHDVPRAPVPSGDRLMGRLLLVRHGQASWGADDYDVLSPLGWEQSRMLGDSLGARNLVPDLVLHGSMRRHRETAEATLDRAGWSEVETVEDQGWNEFDHVGMLAAEPVPFGDREPSKAEFQTWFESATDRWISGLLRRGLRRELRRLRRARHRGPAPHPVAGRPRRHRGGLHLRRPGLLGGRGPAGRWPRRDRPRRRPHLGVAEPGGRELLGDQGRARLPRQHAGVVQRARAPRRGRAHLPLSTLHLR